MNERVRDLFAVQPDEFVRARDALAKELRAAGNEAQAKEVAALRRPTVTVWALNQLARKNHGALEEFLDASERVRKAQVRGAPGDDLRAAMAAQRGALAKLEQVAAEVLREASTQASPAAVRTMQSTLQAAAAGGPEVRRQLLEGTLREAMEPAGFDALLAAGPVRPAHHAPAAVVGKRSAAHPGRGGAPAKNATEAAHQAKESRRVAERVAKRQVAEARKRANAARAAEQRLRKLEVRARDAEEAAKKARTALDAARAALERLRT
jgi:hypothetical protein